MKSAHDLPSGTRNALNSVDLQQHLAAIVESTDDAIISKDLNGIIRSWNQGAERIFGYTAEEAVGQHVSLLTAPDRVDEIPAILQRISRGERIDHYRTSRRTKDGRILSISLTVSPIRDASGNIVGASKIARDVSEQERYEEALQEANASLRPANADLEQFAYSASIPDAEAKQALRRALASLASAIAGSGASITQGALPWVRMHDFQVEQLFQNLIGNAIRYRSRQPPQIHIGAVRDGHVWRFSVRDNGIGIDPQYKEHIFGIFKRLHGAADYPGTGMGLAICKRIVERAGGRIWVESDLGRGSTFFFTVPAGKRN